MQFSEIVMVLIQLASAHLRELLDLLTAINYMIIIMYMHGYDLI